MDSNSSNEDDEPKICTVFSSAPSNSKSIFDTIAFSVPRKEAASPEPLAASLLFSSSTASSDGVGNLEPVSAMSKTSSMVSILADDLQSGDHSTAPVHTTESDSETTTVSQHLFYSEKSELAEEEQNQNSLEQKLPSSTKVTVLEENIFPSDNENSNFPIYSMSANEIQNFGEHIPNSYSDEIWPNENVGINPSNLTEKLEILQLEDDEEILPAAKSLFADAPEVLFPVNIGFPYEEPITGTVNVEPIFSPVPSALPNVETINYNNLTMDAATPQNTFNNYNPTDASYDAWIPSKETQQILQSIRSGTYVQDTSDTTRLIMPGILHEEDFMDKVSLNIGRIFGDAEASKRKILTADNVNQDDSGLRELIKLGCYRSALNLTKRLLTLYGQGPGKSGNYCKHSPHSLQLWFTRITLLVRIREFMIAGTEVEAFKEFDSVDMYYEFYGEGRKGSMVPFYFRLLAAEIPQYNRKFNQTIDKLTTILITVQQILMNLDEGLTEDGTDQSVYDAEQRDRSLKIWKKREIRVLYSLGNASLFAKDYYNAFNALTKLCRKDPEHEPQLKSAIARLFLQHGDLVSAQKYFQESSELRSLESESDQVDTLLDSALSAIAQSSYTEALSLYKQALILQPENFTILNNMAVCLLYMGKVKESLALMEGTVRHNTPQSLQENVLLNLSSIYELENTDGVKKHSLLKLISEYKGDGVNLASLKLPNLI